MTTMVNFSLIGAMKAGSTTLTDYLRLHPDVFIPKEKVQNYFSYGMSDYTMFEKPGVLSSATRRAVRTLKEYEKSFSEGVDFSVRGDGSDSYYYFPGTAERLHAYNPEMKIIAVLREPVSRAYSSFNHVRSHGLEDEVDFETAFSRPLDSESEVLPLRRYRSLGFYGALLWCYLESFGRSQIHLVNFEEMITDPATTLDRVSRFLGLSEFEATQTWSNETFVAPERGLGRAVHKLRAPVRYLLRGTTDNQNVRTLVKAVQKRIYVRPRKLDPAMKVRLKPCFAEDVALLEKLFGKGFYSDWI